MSDKFYIYYIPGIKIGRTKNPERRIKQQGYSEYEILEIHNDIYQAAKREKELQAEYRLVEKTVKTDYVQQVAFAKKGQEACKGKPGKGAQTQIKNKIGMFGYSKEERLELNTRVNKMRAQISAEKRKKPVDAYEYGTDKFLKSFDSIKDACIFYNSPKLKGTLHGRYNHSKKRYLKFKNL